MPSPDNIEGPAIHNLERAAAWGRVAALFLAILMMATGLIINDSFWRQTQSAQREFVLRVGYEQYLSQCNGHCIQIANYTPLGLRNTQTGAPATPADYAQARAKYQGEQNSNLAIGNVTVDGQTPFDWTHLGA